MEPHSLPGNSDPARPAALLDSLLGSAPVIVAFVDPGRRYLRVSDGLAKFHGLPRDALVGRSVAQVLPDLWPQLEPIYARVLDHGETVAYVELQSRRPGRKEPVYWLASYYPVQVGAEIIAAGVILVDITERKRAEDALHRLNATLESRVAERTEELARVNRELAARARELERSVRFKSEFLANMSHELRTPLNSTLILSRLLADNPEHNLTERQVNYARAIQGSGEDLLRLIDDVLDFAKTESGTLSFHYEQFAFSGVVRTLQRTFRPVAEGKRVEFVIETSPNLPYGLETDPVRLRQILTNLLSNAFKFTERGRISVSIYPVGQGHHLRHPGMVAFEISDTGIGIPKEKRELIFDAFRQADAGTGRKYGGTGLGLAISRQLATQMGGEIRLVSEPGKGSTFTVYLPMRAEQQAAAALSGTPSDAPSGKGARQEFALTSAAEGGKGTILLVDDDPRNRYALSAVLEAEGYTVVTAANGEAALEALERQPDIDCALVDIMMPGMDGYETTRRIRAQPRFARLPVVAVTAKAMASDLQKCMKAGCSDYLSKPVDITQLREILQTLKRK